jgi:hypothetical protein
MRSCFFGGGGHEPLGCWMLACCSANVDHGRVPAIDAGALARACGRFGHLLLVEGDKSHPVMIGVCFVDDCH